MSTSDLVGNYFGRLTEKHYGKPVYIKQKGEQRDDIMKRVAAMCDLMGIHYKILSPARICRVRKPDIIQSAVTTAQTATTAAIQHQIAKTIMGNYNTGRAGAGKTAFAEQVMKKALEDGFSIMRVSSDGTHVRIDP